ncbi:hypothetical protein ACTXT7_005639 [Hymenolepis weldensis]
MYETMRERVLVRHQLATVIKPGYEFSRKVDWTCMPINKKGVFQSSSWLKDRIMEPYWWEARVLPPPL